MTKNKSLEEHYSREISQGRNEMDMSIRQFENGVYYESYTEHGGDYMHLSQVAVNVGGKIYLINSEGIKELDGTPTNRGASVFIQYVSEDGEIFESQSQFHKGCILKKTIKIGEWECGMNENKDTYTHFDMKDGIPLNCLGEIDIWRD